MTHYVVKRVSEVPSIGETRRQQLRDAGLEWCVCHSLHVTPFAFTALEWEAQCVLDGLALASDAESDALDNAEEPQ